MSVLHRLGVAVLLLGGVTGSILGLTYARRPLVASLSKYLASARAAVVATELAWSSAAGIDRRRARLDPRVAARRIEALRAPPRVLLGAHDGELPASISGFMALERAVDQTLLFVQVYSGWGDDEAQAFPTRAVHAIWGIGSVPLITWEPWLSAFEASRHPELRPAAERERQGLSDIAAGRYDFYVDEWARAAAEFGRPLLVRFAHEMNDGYRYPWGPTNNPDPADYVRAFRHVVQRFRSAGAHNVLWVWAPSISYDGYQERYPGSDVVDWVGTGLLNYGTAVRWSQWQNVDQLLRHHYERLTSHGKPLMIAELGTLTAGGDRAAWYERVLRRLPEAYPQVKALVFFHVASDRTVTGAPVRWSFADDPPVALAVRRGLQSLTLPFVD